MSKILAEKRDCASMEGSKCKTGICAINEKKAGPKKMTKFKFGEKKKGEVGR